MLSWPQAQVAIRVVKLDIVALRGTTRSACRSSYRAPTYLDITVMHDPPPGGRRCGGGGGMVAGEMCGRACATHPLGPRTGHLCQKLVDGLLDGFAGGIDHHAIPIPGVIFAIEDLLPGRQLQSGYVDAPGFDPLSVFGRIRTDDLDLDTVPARPLGHLQPASPRQINRVDRIRDDRAAIAQIVLGQGIPDNIARFLDWMASRVEPAMACSMLSMRR